jgi:hypothetical protein
MCRQTLTTLDGTERHRRFYLAVQTSRESSIILATADHSLRDPNPFRRSPPYEIQHIGRDPTIRSARQLLADASVNRCRTVTRLLQTVRPASDADNNQTTLLARPTASFLVKLDKRAAEAAPILGHPRRTDLALHHPYRPFQIRPQDRAVEWRDHR